MDFAPDGDLASFDDQDVADAAQWDGDPTAFMSALLEAGFIDESDKGTTVHDWDEYGGKLLKQRESNAEKVRDWRDKKGQDKPLRRRPERGKDVTVTQPLRNQTGGDRNAQNRDSWPVFGVESESSEPPEPDESPPAAVESCNFHSQNMDVTVTQPLRNPLRVRDRVRVRDTPLRGGDAGGCEREQPPPRAAPDETFAKKNGNPTATPWPVEIEAALRDVGALDLMVVHRDRAEVLQLSATLARLGLSEPDAALEIRKRFAPGVWAMNTPPRVSQIGQNWNRQGQILANGTALAVNGGNGNGTRNGLTAGDKRAAAHIAEFENIAAERERLAARRRELAERRAELERSGAPG